MVTPSLLLLQVLSVVQISLPISRLGYYSVHSLVSVHLNGAAYNPSVLIGTA